MSGIAFERPRRKTEQIQLARFLFHAGCSSRQLHLDFLVSFVLGLREGLSMGLSPFSYQYRAELELLGNCSTTDKLSCVVDMPLFIFLPVIVLSMARSERAVVRCGGVRCGQPGVGSQAARPTSAPLQRGKEGGEPHIAYDGCAVPMRCRVQYRARCPAGVPRGFFGFSV